MSLLTSGLGIGQSLSAKPPKAARFWRVPGCNPTKFGRGTVMRMPWSFGVAGAASSIF